MASGPPPPPPLVDGGNPGKILHQMSGCLVIQDSDTTVVKQGSRILIDEERAALELAAEHGLPVPRVHDAGMSGGEPFIRMDFVPGDRLDTVWKGMTVQEKYSICQQLREIITKMRSIPYAKRRIASCSSGAARDCRHYSSHTGGPFTDEESFNFLFYLDFVPLIPSTIRSALTKEIRSNHRIVFSHGDIAQHNIFVKDGRITGLIDWEYAGWYPEHWDYIKFFDRPCEDRDWREFATDIFPQVYDHELASHQAIIRWQRP